MPAPPTAHTAVTVLQAGGTGASGGGGASVHRGGGRRRGPREQVEMPRRGAARDGIAGHEVYPRLEDDAALAVGEDRAFDRSDDLGAGQAEPVDVRTGQEPDPQAPARRGGRQLLVTLVREMWPMAVRSMPLTV